MPCSSLRGQLRRHQPDATAVLATVKVVRPRAARCGRSTSTPAAGRKIRQLRREQAHAPSPHRHTRLTFSSVVYGLADRGVEAQERGELVPGSLPSQVATRPGHLRP